MRKKFLVLLSIVAVIFISHIFTPVSFAASSPPLGLQLFAGAVGLQPKTPVDYLKEFCDKRSGELMNLETWYSGKCSAETDTLSGDGVGFSDIVFLQGMEYLFGAKYDTFADWIIKSLKSLQDFSTKLNAGIAPQDTPEFAELTSDGLLPNLAKITTVLINTKPASSLDYVAYVSQNLKSHNVIKEAYAAGPGYGFTALSPVLPLWRAFRNITYILFALAFVIYGLMIMLRVRVDAKTTATIQLAIPKLISTLLLITFSYSIVGFLVDLCTVATGLSINILRVGGILTSQSNFLVDTAGGLTFGGLGSMLLNSLSAMITAPFILFNLLIGGGTGVIVGAIVGLAGLSGYGVVIAIIIFLAVGWSYFKLIMKLFESFFSVIVSLIFAPVLIFGNIFPGSNAFSSWMMTIIGNLAVFPVATFFLVLSYAMMAQPILSIVALLPGVALSGLSTILGVNNISTFTNIWTPPMTVPTLMNSSSGGVGGGTGTSMGSIGSLMIATIGFGILMMASKYVDMVKEALKTPPFKYGAAIGEALKYGAGKAGQIDEKYIPRLPVPGRFRGAQTQSINTALDAASQYGGSKPQPDRPAF